MRIYIHTDMEGISGIDGPEMIQRESPRRREAEERLMDDVNAAVAGAFEGGATEVTVLDSHGGGGNFILERLDPRARNDPKANRKWWGMLDASYHGTFFVGAHAMAGTQNGFLDHTQSSASWYDYRVNGRRVGELGQWAMVAGHFGVPMLMVSGDEAACVEARQFFNPLETAAVKRGVGRNRAELLPAEEAHRLIRAAACRAVALAGRAKPFAPTRPMEIVIEFCRSDYADDAAKRPGNERIGPRTIRKVAAEALDLFP